MKSIKTLSFFIIIFALSCTPKPETFGIGIVTGSSLNCREKPSLKSKIIKSYSFGTPLILTKKSNNTTRINKKEFYWYQVSENKGWVYGKYLLKTPHNKDSFKAFNLERIRCNYVCGGFSCFATFSPYFINDYYIVTTSLNDYPESKIPHFGIIIGKYTKTSNKILFGPAIHFVAYDSDGNYVVNPMSKSFEDKKNIKNFSRIFYKKKDSDGNFYHFDKTKNIDRIKLRNDCKNTKKQIWEDILTIKNIPFKVMMKKFPLIQKTKKGVTVN